MNRQQAIYHFICLDQSNAQEYCVTPTEVDAGRRELKAAMGALGVSGDELAGYL